MGCEVDLPKGTLSYQLPESIVPHVLKIMIRELAALAPALEREAMVAVEWRSRLTREVPGKNWQAVRTAPSQHQSPFDVGKATPSSQRAEGPRKSRDVCAEVVQCLAVKGRLTFALRPNASDFPLLFCMASSASLCEDCPQSRPLPQGHAKGHQRQHSSVSVGRLESQWGGRSM